MLSEQLRLVGPGSRVPQDLLEAAVARVEHAVGVGGRRVTDKVLEAVVATAEIRDAAMEHLLSAIATRCQSELSSLGIRRLMVQLLAVCKLSASPREASQALSKLRLFHTADGGAGGRMFISPAVSRQLLVAWEPIVAKEQLEHAGCNVVSFLQGDEGLRVALLLASVRDCAARLAADVSPGAAPERQARVIATLSALFGFQNAVRLISAIRLQVEGVESTDVSVKAAGIDALSVLGAVRTGLVSTSPTITDASVPKPILLEIMNSIQPKVDGSIDPLDAIAACASTGLCRDVLGLRVLAAGFLTQLEAAVGTGYSLRALELLGPGSTTATTSTSSTPSGVVSSGFGIAGEDEGDSAAGAGVVAAAAGSGISAAGSSEPRASDGAGTARRASIEEIILLLPVSCIRGSLPRPIVAKLDGAIEEAGLRSGVPSVPGAADRSDGLSMEQGSAGTTVLLHLSRLRFGPSDVQSRRSTDP